MYNAYLYFAPEKGLLEKLVRTHIEFIKFKEQGSASADYNEKCEEYEEKC